MSEVRTVYEDDDFCLKLENEQEILFIHCYVDNYNKQVRKKISEVFQEVKEACIYFGWDAIHSYTKNPKFAKMFEGSYKLTDFSLGDEQYEVIRWELGQQ